MFALDAAVLFPRGRGDDGNVQINTCVLTKLVSFSLLVFQLYQGSSCPGLLCHTYLSVVHTRALLTSMQR